MVATFPTVALRALFCVGFFVSCGANTDIPVDCRYEQILGNWTFYVGDGGQDKNVDCPAMSLASYKSTFSLTLQYPDVVTDEFGNTGFWTLIYNEGFEVVVHGRKYFAFSNYTDNGLRVTSYCDSTLPGWSHDVLGHDWACYYGRKPDSILPRNHDVPPRNSVNERDRRRFYRTDDEFIAAINAAQSSWTAVHYPQYDHMTVEQMIRRAGGNRRHSYPKPAPVTEEQLRKVAELPDEWDWRNVSGINYVTPVRNQESCGSCFAFASTAMVEARIRVASNNTLNVILSPQDVLDCCQYTQGCDGGFPYLVAGKYAEDFGLVEESCKPYEAITGECTTSTTCARHYTTSYKYIGGYYGGCNEPLMRLELYEHGPIAVGFEVSSDFWHYRSGVYRHQAELRAKYDPFQICNHAVTIVGYGFDRTTSEKIWIVKNSWGKEWGEHGYFRIRRGTDEQHIESAASKSDPIF